MQEKFTEIAMWNCFIFNFDSDMSVIKEIEKLLNKDLKSFQQVFSTAMDSKVPLLDIVLRYIHKQKGKQMRPMFVFLSAHLAGEPKKASARAASLIELLHTATLVHDDVVDEAEKRRNLFSINALWKNKVAVLAGDFLLSRGLSLALAAKDYEVLEIVSEATREMAEGELLQIEKARRLDIKEEVYFEIIRKKTATLISSCCAAGAASVGANIETILKMKLFGEYVGIAFQIKDDLFDFQKSNKIGKPQGIDIKEQKMTLPLIYMLNNLSATERKQAITIVKKHHNNPEKVSALVNQVNASGGIAYAEQQMYVYRDKALAILNEFPRSEYRLALENLVKYTCERKK
ncbi:MAG: polyprenyl synthetase family protein [Bacteroidales bacterium]|nr:polyprenyl synthetase family protein [Bacteroidales bacterium]